MKKQSPAQANLAKLPHVCAAIMPSSGEPIIIHAGENGYHQAPTLKDQAGQADIWDFNAAVGANRAHMEAMLYGSMFGWEKPLADPDNYDPRTGSLKKRPKKEAA